MFLSNASSVFLLLFCHVILQAAAEHWLGLGVDGIKISDLNIPTSSPDWTKVRNAIQGNRTDGSKSR